MPTLDLQNSALWQEVYQISVSAEYTSPAVYKPISPILVPIQLTAHLIATFTECNNAPPHWYSAGFMHKEISIGIFAGNQQNTKYGYSRRVPLRRAQITLWENFGESYKLTFKPHKYFDQMSFYIWQYIGEIPEISTEQFDALRIDILRVEKMLQFVSLRDVPTRYDVSINNADQPNT
jgi:hypothetical protein